MIFKKIMLENWRGLYDSEINLNLNESLNVVTGPNESGKSTTLEAIKLALSTKASSRKSAVKSCQPWGTDLKPRVELEFRANGKDYRLKKTYLKSTGNTSFAEKLEDGSWTTLAEDDDAHDRFLKTLDLTGAEGFFRSLWVPQGGNLKLEVNEGLQSRIEEAVGTATSEAGDAILDYVVDNVGNVENTGWLTKKRRNPASGSPWAELADQIDQLESELEELKGKRREHYDRLEEIGELQQEKRNLEEKSRQKEEELEKNQEKKKEWDEFREIKEEAEEARKWYDRLMNARQDWDDRVDKIEEKDEEIGSLREKLNELKKKRDEKKSLFSERESRYEEARGSLKKSKARMKYLLGLRAVKLNEEIENLESEITELNAPDEDRFKELESVHEELESSRRQLEASELSIKIKADESLNGTLKLDEESERLTLPQDEDLERGAAKSFELKLEDLLDIRVETGMEGALQVKNELANYEEELKEAYRKYDVEDWEELAEIHEEAKSKRYKREDLLQSLSSLALENPESYSSAKLDNLRESSSEYLDDSFLNSAQEAEPEEIRERIKEKKESITEEKELLERKREEVESAEDGLNEINDEIKGVQNEIDTRVQLKKREIEGLNQTKKEITKLDERFDKGNLVQQEPGSSFDRSAEENGELYRELDRAWGEARDRRDELEHEASRIKPSGNEVTETTIEEKEGVLEKLKNKTRKLEKRINRLQGEIGNTADGLHERIREKKEELGEKKRQLKSTKKEVRSQELLRIALENSKEKTSRKYLEPIQEKVVPRIREMTDRRYEEVNFDSDMKPDSLVQQRRESRAEEEELSFGTREQLSFLTRLSMAEVIGGNSRIPVIFDDSLVNTDEKRMKYSRKYLKEAASSCQIILFTCHGEDYHWDGEENRIELGQLP
jgi:DNA repair exonuclease SbcCD ATPase subunit